MLIYHILTKIVARINDHFAVEAVIVGKTGGVIDGYFFPHLSKFVKFR